MRSACLLIVVCTAPLLLDLDPGQARAEDRSESTEDAARGAERGVPETGSRTAPAPKPKAPEPRRTPSAVPRPPEGPGVPQTEAPGASRDEVRPRAVPTPPPRAPDAAATHAGSDIPPEFWLKGVVAYSLIQGQRVNGLTNGYSVRLEFHPAVGIEPTHWRAAFGDYQTLPGHVAWKPWPASGDPSLPIDPNAVVKDFTISAAIAVDGTESDVRQTTAQYRKLLQDFGAEVLRHPTQAQPSAELRLTWTGAATDVMVAPPGKEAPRQPLVGSPPQVIEVPIDGGSGSLELVVQLRDHHAPSGTTRILEDGVTLQLDAPTGFEPVLSGITEPGTTVPSPSSEPTLFTFDTSSVAEVMQEALARGQTVTSRSPDNSGACIHRNEGSSFRLTLVPTPKGLPTGHLHRVICQYELFAGEKQLAAGWRVVAVEFSRHLERPSGENEESDLRLLRVEMKEPQLPGSSLFWIGVEAPRVYPGDLVFLRLDSLLLEGPPGASDWRSAFD